MITNRQNNKRIIPFSCIPYSFLVFNSLASCLSFLLLLLNLKNSSSEKSSFRKDVSSFIFNFFHEDHFIVVITNVSNLSNCIFVIFTSIMTLFQL